MYISATQPPCVCVCVCVKAFFFYRKLMSHSCFARILIFAISAVNRKHSFFWQTNGIVGTFSPFSFWLNSSAMMKICWRVHVPPLQTHANQFFGVFRWEHGGADLRVTAAGNLWPVWEPLALLGHQLWGQVRLECFFFSPRPPIPQIQEFCWSTRFHWRFPVSSAKD